MEKYTLTQIKEKKLKKLEISFETDKTVLESFKDKIFNKKQETNEEEAIYLTVREKEIEVAPNKVLEKYITNKEKLVPELKKYLSYKDRQKWFTRSRDLAYNTSVLEKFAIEYSKKSD